MSTSNTVNESLYQLHKQQQWNLEVTKRSIELERFESIQAESFRENVGFMPYSPSVRMSMSPAKKRSVESGGKESFQQSLYEHDISWKEAIDKKREEMRQSIAKEQAADDDLNCTYHPKLETELHNSHRLNVTSHTSRDDCLIDKHSMKDVLAYKMAQLRAKYEKEYSERFTFTPNKEKREREAKKQNSSHYKEGCYKEGSVHERLYQQQLEKSTMQPEPHPDLTFKPKLTNHNHTPGGGAICHEKSSTVTAADFERLHRSGISNVSSAHIPCTKEKKVISKDKEDEMLDRLTRRDVARRQNRLASSKRQVEQQLDKVFNTDTRHARVSNGKILDRRRRERLSEIYYVLLMSVLLNRYNNGLIEDAEGGIEKLIKKVSVADDLDLFYAIAELLEPPSLGEAILGVINDKSTFTDEGRSVLTLESFTHLAMQYVSSGGAKGKALDSILIDRCVKKTSALSTMTTEEMEYRTHFTGKPEVPKAHNAHRKAGREVSDYLIAHKDRVLEKVALKREQVERERLEGCSFEPTLYSKSSYRRDLVTINYTA